MWGWWLPPSVSIIVKSFIFVNLRQKQAANFTFPKNLFIFLCVLKYGRIVKNINEYSTEKTNNLPLRVMNVFVLAPPRQNIPFFSNNQQDRTFYFTISMLNSFSCKSLSRNYFQTRICCPSILFCVLILFFWNIFLNLTNTSFHQYFCCFQT